CTAKDNGGDGFYNVAPQALLVGCVSHNNGAYGVVTSRAIRMIHCVVDENDLDGVRDNNNDGPSHVLFCRVTDNGKSEVGSGIQNAGTGPTLYGWCFFADNYDSPVTGDTLALPFRDDADTNETAGTEGYVDGAADDFNLVEGATLRDVTVYLDDA
ncbi:MAG TPA: right-handed parallel beta-helix repeat-containing protein, partial [Phycisphaerae bacterium]|nr:right-handed parallel beta-helix repeat-containing protein [Phycisphaerae bacterium]